MHLSLALIAILPLAMAADWDYYYKGRDWNGVCKTGDSQSPIAVGLQSSLFDQTLGNLQFDYSDHGYGEYVNNGHSITYILHSKAPKSFVSGGGLPCEYQLHSLHYHWGTSNADGSEHVVNGQRAALELHLVHFNPKYRTLARAVKRSDGLAVVGLLFNPIEDNYCEPLSKAGGFLMQEMNQKLDQLTHPDDKLRRQVVNMTRFVQDIQGGANFFRYQGSLTTPTCDESVTWSVIAQTFDVSSSLLDKFRATVLKDINGQLHTSANYRALQRRNGRDVLTNDAAAPQAVDICNLPRDAGNCEADIKRYYFDSASGRCRSFSYGGCDGNANNFRSRKACMMRCIVRQPNPTPAPNPTDDFSQSSCFLRPDVGPCRKNETRYFYDARYGKCRKFTYGGCQGNENNFSSKGECYHFCHGVGRSAPN